MYYALMGDRIKAEQNKLGLTLEQMSEKIGISRNYLWEIEAGRKLPAVNTLVRIGEVLNVSIDYLLGITADKDTMTREPPATERDIEMARIKKELEKFDTKELSLILSIIRDFSKYLKQK